MPRKNPYAAMFTLRADGRYQKRLPSGKYLYDRDPEALFRRVQEALNPPPATFRVMAEAWEVEHMEALSRGTQTAYKPVLAYAVEELGDLPMSEVTASEINRLMLREKARGYSHKHAASVKSIIKQICDHAIVAGELQYNPCSAVRVPRGLAQEKVEAPSEDTQARIVSNLDTTEGGKLVAFLYYTGMRTQEAVGLRWSDIDLDAGTISVNHAVDLHGTPLIKETKTENGNRIIPILDPLRPYCQRPDGAKPTDYIWNREGKLLTRGQVNSIYLQWCKSAGLAVCNEYAERHRGQKECTRHEWRPVVSLHQLRHNFCTILFEAGIDELTAQELMGHADIAFTRKQYTSLRAKQKTAQIDRLNKAFNPDGDV